MVGRLAFEARGSARIGVVSIGLTAIAKRSVAVCLDMALAQTSPALDYDSSISDWHRKSTYIDDVRYGRTHFHFHETSACLNSKRLVCIHLVADLGDLTVV